MTCSKLLRAAAALAWLALPQAGWSVFDPVNDDTDIFLANPAFTATRPNVLIFVDNTANWSQSTGAPAPLDTKYGGVKAALTAVLNGVVTDAYNVGLSLFVETGNPNNTVDGSYVRYGVRQMTITNKNQLVSMINALDNNGDKGNNATYSLAMAEMFKYFAGVSSYSGHGKNKTDAGETIYFPSGRQALASSPLAAGALPANGGTAQTYVSPIVDGCQKNFIIFISNGEAGDNASSLSTAQGFLSAITGTSPPATIPISPNGEEGLWADEYAKFMASGDCNASVAGVQNVFTYTLDIIPKSTGQGPSHTALLKSMAINGKGKYYAITDMSSTAPLENALKAIFTEVQAVNSVFASTTLPVSVNVRGTNLNQVYIGVFRPDANKSPRWLGNLKLYKLGVDTATQNLFIADVTGGPAENAGTGFISANATSYWTATSSFWSYRDPTLNGVGGASDSPDGDLVEKGGAAQRLRTSFPSSNSARNLYTCASGSGLCAPGDLLSASPFVASSVAPADVGAYTAYNLSTINWDSATNLATMVLGAAPAPAWSSGDTVRVAGVTPTVFNGDFTVTQVNATTYTYTLSPGPDSTRGRVHAPGHLLSAGDYVYLFASCPSPYTSWTPDCVSPTSFVRPITRVDANNFDYDLNGSASTPLTQSQFFAYGLRLANSVRGLIGGSNVLVSIPGHGYGANGTTLSCIYVADGALDSEWYTSYCNTATIVDADTLSVPVSYVPISAALGATSNTAQVTVPGHVFSTGQTVTVTGSSVAAYNGAQSITRLDANTVSFPSASVTADSGAGIRMGAKISSITHPASGSGSNCGSTGTRDTATVTTATAHNFAVGQTINIFGTGAFTPPGGPFTGYDASWVVQSAPSSTTFTIFNACVDQAPSSLSPAAGLAGFTVSSISPTASTTTSNASSGSKPIYLWRYFPQADSDRPLSSGSGVMSAGRPSDNDTGLRDLIVNWARSTDNKDDENLNTILTDVRASAHGDVLHSRPATINYNRLLTLITGTDTDSATMRDSDVYAFYGSNDGTLHAVKGGILQRTDGTTLPVTVGPDANVAAGTERWGFVPKEFFPKLKRLRDQTPTISNLNQKDYFFDGSIGVYQKDVKGNGNAATPLNCDPADTVGCSGATVSGVLGDNVDPIKGDKVHVYLSLRRGGNFIYALNVLNPAAPKLLWRKGNGDAGWGRVAQTWSEPKIARAAANLGNANNPDNVVLIFGGGYEDRLEDVNPCLIGEWYSDRIVQKAIGSGTVTYTAAGSCTVSNATGGTTTFNRTVGQALMVVDAFNGNVVWQASASVTTSSTGLADGSQRRLKVAGMTCGLPSDVTVLDKDRNGIADRLYTGDTCGNVWRADISATNMDNWKVTQIATLSGSGATTLTNKVKFLFPPDLVFGSDAAAGSYTAVLLGSGDREHPFDATVQNAFFMIKDRNDASDASRLTGAPNNTTVSVGVPSPNTLLASPTLQSDMFDATNVVVDNSVSSSDKGWFVSLRAGEKVVGSAVTIAGTTFFNTNQPSSTAGGGACSSNLGVAREYLVGFADAAATVDLQGLGTLSIANRSTIHAGGGYLPSPVPVVVEIDGKKYQAVISGTSVQTPPGLTLEKRTRAFWYKQID